MTEKHTHTHTCEIALLPFVKQLLRCEISQALSQIYIRSLRFYFYFCLFLLKSRMDDILNTHSFSVVMKGLSSKAEQHIHKIVPHKNKTKSFSHFLQAMLSLALTYSCRCFLSDDGNKSLSINVTMLCTQRAPWRHQRENYFYSRQLIN